eukprot:CAMPEP_0201567392 /NCGR_PEP_ID=MMETSP0190_2-20130828/7884_1 /ASSEMBLY_ACC=CAM_ASM_000263 /TAXON_ID=37353 /ORGANISM="Rosalina sp." /LENGTH=581 /DNA_ID=CAMNT_0047987349 /DNA_START=247 /DNA_END=1993 /DNA_ORIENTATION=-
MVDTINIFDSSDPHIVVIVADDIGWGDLGYGGAEFPTTNIDQLRQQGISLNRMYAHESGSATRAALLTGIPGYALGLQNGIDTGSSAHIPLDVKTLPELLKSQRGYATHMVGKWALGYSKWEYTPTKRGFDTFMGFHQRYIDYWHYSATIEANEEENKETSVLNNEMLMGYDLWKNDKIYTPPIRMQYATELFDNELDTIIDDHVNGDNPDQPMFLYYTPPNAHAPIQYHYEYDNECSYIKETSELIRWKYCNLMQELDASVGALVKKLKESDMWDRTILLFTSDNGGLMCWDVGSVNSCSGSVNLPLRGGKGTLFEGSIRVRSILSGGFLDESLYGTSSEQLMHSTDLMTSLAEAANIEQKALYGHELSETGGTDSDQTTDSDESDSPKSDITGLPFWSWLIREDDAKMPNRDEPFIADMKLDPTSSYIEKAAVFWEGYKYIIQPTETYDGWWQSPLQGPSEIPSNSEGVETQPQPLPQSVGANTIMDVDDDSNTIQWTNLRMNEYLFKIDDDPAETQNLATDPQYTNVMTELRQYLISLAGAPRGHISQDATTSVDSDPNRFGNVWYPFEENYKPSYTN